MLSTKQKSSLKQAITLVEAGGEIAYGYARYRNYRLTKSEMRRMDELLEALWQHHCTLETVIKQLKKQPDSAIRLR